MPTNQDQAEALSPERLAKQARKQYKALNGVLDFLRKNGHTLLPHLGKVEGLGNDITDAIHLMGKLIAAIEQSETYGATMTTKRRPGRTSTKQRRAALAKLVRAMPADRLPPDVKEAWDQLQGAKKAGYPPNIIDNLWKEFEQAAKSRGIRPASVTAVKRGKLTHAAHYHDGKNWYGDTAFINSVSRSGIPGEVVHMGFGEFTFKAQDGSELEFDRMRGKDFPGQSGRSHQLYDNRKGKFVEQMIKALEKKGLSEKVEASAKGKTMKRKRRAQAAPNSKVVQDLKTMGILPPTESPADYPPIGQDDTWESLYADPVATTAAKKEITSTLIKAGRPDLANEVSRSPFGRTAVKAVMFKDKKLDKIIDNLADGADGIDVRAADRLAVMFPDKKDAQVFEKKAAKVPGVKSATLSGGKSRDGMFVVNIQAKTVTAADLPTVLVEDDLETLDDSQRKRWKGYTYRMTYEKWTPEDVEFGDTDDKGWEVEESEDFDSLEELLGDVDNYSWIEWSSSSPRSGDWIISQDDEDFRTGERTIYNLFIERADKKPLTKEEIKFISQSLRIR